MIPDGTIAEMVMDLEDLGKDIRALEARLRKMHNRHRDDELNETLAKVRELVSVADYILELELNNW